MVHQGRYGRLGETEVVGDAGEAVAKDVGRDALEWRALEELVPVLGKADQCLAVFGSRNDEDVILILVGAERVQQVENREADRPY